MSLEDADLIARVLVYGEHHAFGELVKRHQSFVRSLLRNWVREDDAIADDLAQETFLKAYKNLRQYSGLAQFSTWLYQIAYNEFRMWFRSHRSEVSLDLVPEESSVDSDQKNHDLRGDLRAALAALSVEERSAIVCCSVQGMSHSEAAIVLGWPIGTVKTHLLRGKEKMKLRLADWAPEG